MLLHVCVVPLIMEHMSFINQLINPQISLQSMGGMMLAFDRGRRRGPGADCCWRRRRSAGGRGRRKWGAGDGRGWEGCVARAPTADSTQERYKHV
jgi:hypothetical protein